MNDLETVLHYAGSALPVPLPHTGQRQELGSYTAMIQWKKHPDVCCFEVRDGNPDPLPFELPQTYALRAGDLAFY